MTGETVEKQDEEQETPDLQQQENIDDGEGAGDGSGSEEDGEGEGEGEQETEFEVHREGQPQSQEGKIPPWGHRRMDRHKEQRDKAREKANAEKERADALAEENRILDLQNKQLQGKQALTQRPNPNDFALGDQDPDYIKNLDAWDEARLYAKEQQRRQETQQSTVTPQTTKAQEEKLDRAVLSHIERAAKLGAKDFEETEQKAVKILGDNLSNFIIMNSKKSHLIHYFLGKNETEAYALRRKIKEDPGGGVILIGELAAELKTKGVKKTTTTPNPDEPIQGSGNPKKKLRGPPGAKFY